MALIGCLGSLLEMIMQLDHLLSIVPKYVVERQTYIEGASPAEVELEFEGIDTPLRVTNSLTEGFPWATPAVNCLGHFCSNRDHKALPRAFDLDLQARSLTRGRS